MNRSELWARVYAASIIAGRTYRALERADEAVRLFDERFRSRDQILRDAAHHTSTTAEAYVTDALLRFREDPADSDYQRGYLMALIGVAEEMIIDDQDPLLEALKEQLNID